MLNSHYPIPAGEIMRNDIFMSQEVLYVMSTAYKLLYLSVKNIEGNLVYEMYKILSRYVQAAPACSMTYILHVVNKRWHGINLRSIYM